MWKKSFSNGDNCDDYLDTRTFRIGDNWHAHLRQDELLSLIYSHFNIYGRVLCMGNTLPLIESVEDALGYKDKIMNRGGTFQPVMCIMLTQDTTPGMIDEAARRGVKHVKFIPVGTSTGASKGFRLDDFALLRRIIPAIIKNGMYLLIHAELMSLRDGTEIDLVNREAAAIDALYLLVKLFPRLKITIEHVSTALMLDFIKAYSNGNIRATLTPQHALLTYDDVFGDKKWPPKNVYNYCLPVLKNEKDRLAVVAAMISGDDRYFAGTDSASHLISAKTSDKIPAGIFFGYYEYLRYLEIFERENALDKFEDFTSVFGAQWYGYPLNTGNITVAKKESIQPAEYRGIKYCLGGEKLNWEVIKVNGEEFKMVA